MARLILALLVMATALPDRARAEVSPAFDASREQLLLESPRSLRRDWKAPRQLRDGLIRARLRPSKDQPAELLVRGGSGSGLALQISRHDMTLLRVDEGRRTTLAGPRHLHRTRGVREMEIVLLLHSSHAVAAVFDAASGKGLGEMATSQAPGGGDIILGAGARWLHLSARAACNAATASGGGPMLVARVEAEHVPPGTGEVLERGAEPVPHLVIRTSLGGLEGISCAGLRVLGVSVDYPFKYVDRGFTEERRAPPADRLASLKNPAMVEALLRAWHRRHPGLTRLEELGRSHQGRAILALAVAGGEGRAESRPQVLISGATHGEEPFSTEIVLDVAAWLLSDAPEARRLRSRLRVWLVPVVNPDGLHFFMEVSRRGGRKNGRDLDRDGSRGPDEGVDLNRNFPFRWGALGERGSRTKPSSRLYRGPGPGSEPETRALMALAERERFTGALCFHTGAVAVLAPYTVPGARSPRRDEAWAIAQELVEGLPPHPHGRDWRAIRRLYPVDGTDQDWLRHAHGTVALLVEATRWSPVEQATRAAALEALSPLWRRFLVRVADGPSVRLRVTDERGRPVEAGVEVRELRGRAGEHWTTRARDGRYHRLIPKSGRYTLRLSSKGFPTLQEKLEVGSGPYAAEITMRRRR